MKTKVTELLQIEYPIIQGGMAWVAEHHLAAAVSEAGGFGLIGAASAPPEIVREEIRKAKELTDKPFGVNIMLLNPNADEVAKIVVEEGIQAVTTGAGNPEKYMPMWKEAGVKVIPVVASVAMAKRMERYGADAVVAEGMEAGGHIGNQTTMALIPQIVDAVNIPVIAAGGIGDGRGVAASFMLGAEGVQMGTRFALTEESSASPVFKDYCLSLGEGDTKLLLKKLAPTRLVKNGFRYAVEKAEDNGASPEELRMLLGKGRAKKGMFEGDLEEGELEIGQVSSIISRRQSVAEVMSELIEAYRQAVGKKYLFGYSDEHNLQIKG